MSIYFSKDKLLDTPAETGSYLCLFPSISLKECGTQEHELKTIYDQYPDTSYYAQHASTGQRGKLGEYNRFPPKDQQPGILNLYIKVYPGSKAYPNDNNVLRIRNFGKVFKSLAEAQGISVLHLDIPSNIPSERQDYFTCLEDYITTCQLHGNNTAIFIHGKEVVKKEQVITKTKIRVRTQEPVQTPAPAPAPAPIQTYKLEFNQDSLSSVTLYEVDFMQTSGSVGSEPPNVQKNIGILSLFPAGWERITDDTILIKEAIKVQEKLNGVLGNKDIFPPTEDIFNAFAYLKEEPKVIILGQDPYHGPGQAHGLAFSVRKGIKIPPSLNTIYDALRNDDVAFQKPNHGCLTKWAEQGIIMLNATLSVEQKKPKSHVSIWSNFTDRLIQLLSMKYTGLVFVLWGNDAKKKKSLIAGTSHYVLEFNHPSPIMPNNTFATECKHFSQINKYLKNKGKTPIDWNLDLD